MSDDILAKAVEALREKFGGGGLDSKVKFDIEGVGAVLVDGATIEPSDADADVVISASPDVFQDMLAGALDPTSAYMSGKIKIDGDMGVAMKLAQALS